MCPTPPHAAQASAGQQTRHAADGKTSPFFPRTSLRYFLSLLCVLCAAAWATDSYLATQSDIFIRNTSWISENQRIKENNDERLRNMDRSFPLMATPGGIEPLSSGKTHRILTVADSYSMGDGAANLNDVWWRQLQRELQRRGFHDVEVLALGRNGASTAEEFSWLRDPRMAALRPECILMGYVANDPDMGLVPQLRRREYRQPLIDSLFRPWLPELTEQFQRRYSFKRLRAAENSATGYEYETWTLEILKGENYRRYETLVSQLGTFLRGTGIPYFMMTLPTSPNGEYFRPRHALPLRTFAQAGIPVFDILEDFIHDKGAPHPPLYWAINPANGHPGPAATLYYAQKAADYLEAHYPEVLGARSHKTYPPRINDWYPWLLKTKHIAPAEWEFTLPRLSAMSGPPLSEPNVLLAFENPVPLQKVVFSTPKMQHARVYASTVDASGLDDRKLYELRHIDGIHHVPSLPPGHMVNTLRIVPHTGQCRVNMRLHFAGEAF